MRLPYNYHFVSPVPIRKRLTLIPHSIRVSFPEKAVIASEENQPSLVHSSPEEGEESSPKQVQGPRAQAELYGPRLFTQHSGGRGRLICEFEASLVYVELKDSQG